MEALPLVTPAEDPGSQDPWARQFSETLQLQHGRVRGFLDAQRQRWRDAESQLCRQIEQLAAEVETLRGTCSRLEQELAGRSAQGPETHAGSVEITQQYKDWESEKSHILAALESEADPDNPQAAAGRRKIEEIVRRTDQLLAEKDREIGDLQNLLKSQSDNLGSVAVGAAALDQFLDQDAIVHEERENLKRLQVECREKLRQAEIDLSLERAKVARQRAEVEEKLRMLELRSKPLDDPAEALCPTGRPVRGRWLARLGLSEADEKPGSGPRGA